MRDEPGNAEGIAPPPASSPVRTSRFGRRSHPLLWFVLRRLAAGAALLLAVSVLVFAGTQILPGDAANAILGRYATPEGLTALRQQLDLDKPLPQRYATWIGELARGDLGDSVTARRPVTELISERLRNTMVLALVTVVLMLPLAIALGVWTGIRAGRPIDHALSAVSLALISVPEFVTAALLALWIGVVLGLLPAVSLVPPGTSPLDHPEILVLPVVTLLVVVLGYSIRMLRASVADVMSSEYVEMARLNGLPERRVVLRHALPNALAPTVQVIALTILYFAGGVVTVEWVFAYPGIGDLTLRAVGARDLPLVQGIAMVVTTFYIAIITVADLLVILLIPKLRTAQ